MICLIDHSPTTWSATNDRHYLFFFTCVPEQLFARVSSIDVRKLYGKIRHSDTIHTWKNSSPMNIHPRARAEFLRKEVTCDIIHERAPPDAYSRERRRPSRASCAIYVTGASFHSYIVFYILCTRGVLLCTLFSIACRRVYRCLALYWTLLLL